MGYQDIVLFPSQYKLRLHRIHQILARAQKRNAWRNEWSSYHDFVFGVTRSLLGQSKKLAMVKDKKCPQDILK